MGEYAKYAGREIKIGTCEEMYYLRADQARMVQPMSGNVDPVRDAAELRFRFPFPQEDKIAPGAFEDFSKGVALHIDAPEEIEHYSVQFSAHPGYLVSLPCPESRAGKALDLKIHRNGFGGAVKIVQQRCPEGLDGVRMLVCACGGCGAKWRVDVHDVGRYVEACMHEAKLRVQDKHASEWWLEVAKRIVDGYKGAEKAR